MENSFYDELAEQKGFKDLYQRPIKNEVIEISDKIENRNLKNYGKLDRLCDFLTEGKKSYFWYSLGAVGPPSLVIGSRLDNLGLAAGGLIASLASIAGSSIPAHRGEYDSIKEKRISELEYSEFKKLEENL